MRWRVPEVYYPNTMTQGPSIRRRSVVRYAGIASLVALAGCSDGGGGGGGSEDNETGNETNETGGSEDGNETDNETNETDSHGHGGELDSPSADAEVEMVTEGDEHHFEPHAVWVEQGGTVTWTLASGSHSATAYHSDNDRPDRVPEGTEAWDSGVLSEQGATFEYTFDQEGVYDYFCIPHETIPMVGTVLVGNPDPENQPGLAPPQDDLPEEAQTAIEELNQQVSDALN